jgi:hypothetical protein
MVARPPGAETADQVEDKMSELARLITAAKTTDMYKLLGFESWHKYVVDVAEKNLNGPTCPSTQQSRRARPART